MKKIPKISEIDIAVYLLSYVLHCVHDIVYINIETIPKMCFLQ